MEGSFEYGADSEATEYAYQVNTDTLEYSITKTAIVVIDTEFDSTLITGSSGDSKVLNTFYSAVMAGPSPMIIEGWEWRWTSARVRALDPPEINLAQTWVRMDFHVNSLSKIIDGAFKSTNFWGNPETFFFTTWTVNGSSSTGPAITNSYSRSVSATGDYINRDWMYDDQSTTSHHEADILVNAQNSPDVLITWVHTKAGEGNGFLDGSLSINMPTSTTN